MRNMRNKRNTEIVVHLFHIYVTIYRRGGKLAFNPPKTMFYDHFFYIKNEAKILFLPGGTSTGASIVIKCGRVVNREAIN